MWVFLKSSITSISLLLLSYMLTVSCAFSPRHRSSLLPLSSGRSSSSSSSSVRSSNHFFFGQSSLPSYYNKSFGTPKKEISHNNIHTATSSLLMKDSTIMATEEKIMNETTTNDQKVIMDDPLDEETMDIEKELLQDDDEEEGADVPISTQYRPEYSELSTKFTTNTNNLLQEGTPNGFFIIDHKTIPSNGFTQSQIDKAFSPEEITRLKLEPNNVTVPAALILLFEEQFTTMTRARKESRRRKILVHRGPLLQEEGGEEGKEKREVFDRERLCVGKVGDRVGPGDTLAIQTRMSHNYSECKNHHDEPPFHLPVVYEDDHFAIVNKPEDKIVFSFKNGGYGRDNVKSCLPWFLAPPTPGVVSVMRRPNPVHRIDKGTSGLLVCAKTKPAMVELARMFKERKVKKTYTAIVNGNIQEPKKTSITSQEAKNLGVCIDGHSNDGDSWQIINEELEGQSAVTIWRALERWPLENARNDTVTLVELKPKTGRYHQLRRHMAWVSKCPLLGDKQYDGGGLAKTLRDQGFYLCSNKVTLEHPYYNTPQGRREWNAKKKDILEEQTRKEGSDGSGGGGKSSVRVTEEEDGSVLVHCEIDLPEKFSEFGSS